MTYESVVVVVVIVVVVVVVVVVVMVIVVVVVWGLFSSSPQACWPIDPFTPPPLLGGLWVFSLIH